MADITFYFPSTGAAAHDCAYSASWTDTSTMAHYPMPSSKGTSSSSGRSPYKGAGSPYLAGACQWVSAAQAAREWTTADTFDISVWTRDTNSLSMELYLIIRIFNAAGDTVVGTLYEGSVNTVAWGAAHQSRHADSVSIQNNVSMPENGHLVIEYGFRTTAAGTGSVACMVGEWATGTPLPLNDTETDTETYYPWISFTYGASGYSNDLCLLFES